jgi:hypothetical protein
MTRAILSILFVMISGLWVSAIKPPQAVMKAFEAKIAHAGNISWAKENAHEYEVEFTLNGLNYSANFSISGEWLETESPVSFDKCPQEVQKNFSTAHKVTDIKAVSKIETPHGTVIYEIEIKKGAGTSELFYTANGATIHE